MQKMQAAAGGKGRGANGMPTPAQIQAMQVRSSWDRLFISISEPSTAINASWYVAADAEADAQWGGHAGDDESYDARTRRGPDGHGRDAT
jgi:hypothetical protein